MSDRYHSFLVVLEKDIRDDDGAEVAAAIQRLRGVLSVEPVLASVNSQMAETRAKHELREKLLKLVE